MSRRLRMMLMWALRIPSPSIDVSRNVEAGFRNGLTGSTLGVQSGVPTLREALRGKWEPVK